MTFKIKGIAVLIIASSLMGILTSCSQKPEGVEAPPGANIPTQPLQKTPPNKPHPHPGTGG